MAGLQNNLVDLHACLQADNPADNAQKAHDIVGDIGHTCLQDVTEKDVEYVCSVLFAKDKGAVLFLRNAVKFDDYQNAKDDLLDIIKTFTSKWPARVVPYAVDIKDACVALFTRDKYSKVKSKSLHLLIELLGHVPGSKAASDMDVKKIIEKFFLELTQPTKHGSTVKQLLYHLLGLLAEVYPEESTNYADRLVDAYVRTMKSEMTSKTKKPDLPIIAGCLQGLRHYLVNFTQSAEEGAKHSFAIYKATKMSFSKDIQHTRFELPKAGLELLSKHAPQFNLYIIDDYEVLYDTLKYWTNHHNRDMLHAGTYAMEAVLKQVAEMLVTRAKEGKREGGTFKFFIQKFRTIMDNPDASNKEVSLAIRGYGLFAAPCKIFLSTKDVHFMFNEMMQRSDQIFFDQSGVSDDRIMSLPSYLDALASIIQQLDEVSETFVWSLERLVVVLMENIPKINVKMHHMCLLSLLRVLHAMMPKGAVFRVFLARVVYQSVIRTCSHPVVLVTEESALETMTERDVTPDNKPAISYRSYIDMWTNLLSSKKYKELIMQGVSLEERQALTEAIYAELLAAILRVLSRLDLGSQRDEQTEDGEAGPGTSDGTRSASPVNTTADPVTGLQASKPKDFIVFINLVDFCRDLLPYNMPHLFNDWVFKYGNELILYSTKYPLVSGFYKLLGVCMTICTKTAYFKDIKTDLQPLDVRVKEEFEDDSEPMDVDVDLKERARRSECEACFLLFTKFTREVLTRLKQYKDDLLASCLTFVLSLPKEIVCSEISSLVPALQMALGLGVSYLTLAIVGLDALEQWKRTLPAHIVGPYYSQVLPCLDPYLKTMRDKENGSGETLAFSGTSRKSGKKKLAIKLLAQTKKDAVKAQATQLEEVQQRCITLLGSLGGSTNHHLLSSSPEQVGAQAVAWDTVRHLKFDMPFMDIKPVIYFDPFLPRVAELATTSSERQTKVAACELLHTLVLYIIGRGVQKRAGDNTQRDSMEKLYRKLFPIIATLACDVEQVAKQLFEPLMLQMIHWFTGNKKYESEETMALLDTLLDGIVDPTDTARRDFSAKCLKEFLIWSIKQTSKKQMEKSPGNIKSLLKRLYSLAHHPSAFKRLGASLAFNSIYAVFREEESLVDVFTFQILVNYIESLALAHNDDKSLGTQEQCRQVLTHLERIIKHKATLLSKPTKNRIIPREWNDATLLTAVRWLIRQCGRPHTECRHAAMQLIFSLAPCIEHIKTAHALFNGLQEEVPEYFIVRFERGRYKLQARSGLVQCQTMSRLSDSFTLRLAVNWYDMLLATLDCYTWVFGQNLLNPAKTLVVSGNKGTVLFKVITHFLNDLALEDISAAANLFSVKPDVVLFTPHEREEYNRVKCTAVVRLMDFIVVLFGLHQKDSLKVVPGSFWSDNLWELIVRCVLQPTTVGFNMADVEVMMKLPEQMAQVLQVIGRLPANVAKGFKRCLAEKLAKGTDCDLNAKMPLSLTESGENHQVMLHLVKGMTQLRTLGLLEPAIAHVGDKQKFAERLLNSVSESVAVKEDDHLAVAQLTPQQIDLASALLQLAFTIGLKPKAVLDVLTNKTSLRQPGSGVCQQGAVLYTQFGSALNQHLFAMATDFVPALVYHAEDEWSLVGTIIIGMLDKSTKERSLRKKEGKSLVKLVLEQWRHLSAWWRTKSATAETKLQALQVLTKTLLVDSKMVTDVESDSFGAVFDMYLDLLTDKDTGLSFKSRVLDLLAFFVNVPDHELNKLKGRLDRLVADNFPMRSSEFTVGSPKHSDYITALNKILSALDISGSLMLLELVISIMCRETPHIHEDEIQATLAHFIKRMPMDKHKPALDVPYKIFTKEGSYPDSIRRAALERVCLPILRIAHKGALSEFFSSHIKEIMATLEIKFNKSSEAVFSTQLMSKICAFELLEVMYSRLPKDDVFSKTSQINATYCNQRVDTGKEITTAITKLANAAKGEDCRGESVCVELRREFHCAAYNTLISTISCTQTDIKFYTGFLFNENLAKGQFLLDNIVDEKKALAFPIEMEALHERKKRFVSIRNEVREGKTDEGEDEYETTSVHYLASQYLADSSLSTDISQFDFGSSAATASLSGSIGERRSKMKKRESKYEEPKVTVEADYVEMEMDELNKHECMATMTALLQHMKRNNITPAVEKGVSPNAMPGWMENLHKKMKHHATATNIKLFIAKLLINTEEVFRPYARFWLAPLVQMIVTGETRSPGIHYFIVDIVVTILSWHTVAIPEDTTVDRGMASSLLEFLLKNCHFENRRILRNNLDVIKTLVEVWKDRLDIPHQIIYSHFSTPDKGTSNATGIQMLGVILANKLPPYSSTCGVNKDRYFQHLAMNMTNTHKPVYASSAEVVGMALKHMAEKERSEADREWQDGYASNIAKMLLSIQMTKPDVFITCVYRMQLHHPPVIDKFISKVLFLLPRLHGDYRTHCLEIITSRAEHIDNLYTEMKNKNLHSLLTHRDEGCQLVSLKLVQAMLSKLKSEELLSVLPPIGAFCTHPSASCRGIMYDILMWIYDNYSDDEEEDTETAHSIMSVAKDGLLYGLSDEDLKNRLTIQNFWSHETRLPTSTVDRMVAMLEAMYSPKTEAKYLAYATNLLLEMTSKSPDYNRAIFEHPLSECRFEDYTITSSWRQRHAAMTPLFVATQMSQSQGDMSMSTDDLSGQVRQTQDVANFTPTQQPGSSKAPYNWLTQSSLDTFSDYNLTVPATGETQSSLLFTVGKPPPRKPKRSAPGSGFGKGRAGGSRDETDGSTGESEKSLDILRLKKRFLKDQQSTLQLYFAKKNARLKQLREEVQREQKARRENMVTMYRKYRAGDLPDIQIKYSYVIAPLQALAQRDNHIGRLLFGSLFKSIFPEIEVVKTDREAREMTTQITTSLNAMLNNSTQYCPAFIACVLDIALEFPRRLKLEPNAVNTACLTGQQQPLGIVLLEETLIFGGHEEEERPAKRARGAGAAMSQVSKDTATWIELARLYKSLGEYDVLRGVFSSRVGTQDLTGKAMEAEMRGDYKEALSLYNQGLERKDWDDAPPKEAELDLWDTSRLECCAHLADWTKLEQFTTQSIDDQKKPNLDLVWDDTYFQEHYLPFIIRGRLKLLMEGGKQQDLLDFIDRALHVPDRKALLESSYCEELALLYMWQEDYDRARHFSAAAEEGFLQEWGSLNTLMESSRSVSLQRLQKLTELKEFLNFMKHDSNFHSIAPATHLIHKWLRRTPDPILDSSATWDDIITNRCVYLDHMSAQLEEVGVKEEPGTIAHDPWAHYKVELWLAQANSARQQDNFVVALKQLRKAHKVAKATHNEQLLLEWAATYSGVHIRRAQVLLLSAEERLRATLTAFDQLEKNKDNKILQENLPLGSKHYMLKGTAVQETTSVLQDSLALADFEADLQSKVKVAAGDIKSSDIDEVITGLVEKGFQHLKSAVGIADQGADTERASHDVTGVNDAHMTFVRYCDHYLQQADQEENENLKCPSFGNFRVAIVTSLLTAMRLGSVEARQRFPRLLQIVEKYADTIDVFIRKAARVPCWMYLGWVAQLTAVLDKPESPAVHQILMDIAKTYPNALIYPFKLSNDGYEFDSSPVGKKSKDVRDQLEQILSKNKLVNAFISALEQFGQPNQLFRDWFDDVIHMIAAKPGQRKNEQVMAEFRQMYKDLMDRTGPSEDELYDTQQASSTSQIPDRVAMGKYRRKFAEKFAAKVERLCGKDGKKLPDMSAKIFREGVRGILNEMNDVVSNALKPPGTLKEYSQFLADFQAANYDQDLELPGQYTGLQKPMPEFHVRINSFDERVLVMSSIRKPKRIAIRGNDEKEYLYLVKGGEDLRQDQRIEQLFAIMNEVFTQDAICRQHKYSIRTYQVIPMTSRVGMIEWMKKTMPLKEFLQGAMTPQEKNFYESTKGAPNDHMKFIGGNDAPSYCRSYEIHSRSDIVTTFRRREESVPWDLSRRAYRNLSASREAYFTLRSNFAVSHALVSICQYLLGIGDRHTSNFMVDLVTGCMVGIDFGHAFGSATTFLPIPELMPLRLTRQLRNLLLPLREKGLIEGTMVHALRALRNNSHLLLATMDVFIKEPSLDWQQNAEKQCKTQGIKSDAELDTNWYPKQKVAFAKRKLQGHHPTYIMRDELEVGHKKNKVFRYFEKVLMGDKEHDIRARLPKTDLTVEQQVACLLNQSTDPIILGRVFAGWNSWM